MKLTNSMAIISIIAASALFGATTADSLAAQLNETTNPQVRARIMNQVKEQMQHMNEVQREATLSHMHSEVENAHAEAQHGMESEQGSSQDNEGVNSETEGHSNDSGVGEDGGNDAGGVGGDGGDGGDGGGDGGGGDGGGGGGGGDGGGD
ncbi:MAG: hypothetical protein R3331_07335 [Sulfurospirillaceae bacterium]|nr:hypothetical protein [Sulfurospirillaceae bacterium]